MERIVLQHTDYHVERAQIKNICQLTDLERKFRLVLPDSKRLDYQPGQFVEASLFGVGEAPISICSSPTVKNGFELCVRRVGRFTDALHQLQVGDEVGIRGPFGIGFPLERLTHRDLILVAGGLGLAPLRSLINYILDNRAQFGSVTILFGCRNREGLLFIDEIAFWKQRQDLQLKLFVDAPTTDWQDDVGPVTGAIPKIDIDPDCCSAVICGPPVMYSFVVEELLKRGISKEHIHLSLERHMKCGLGKCGHCQIHHIYCCQDGPVLSYDRIEQMPGAI